MMRAWPCRAVGSGQSARRECGFSMIEAVVVLVLVAVLSAGAGLLFLPLSQAYVLAVRDTESAGRTQAAMSRILIELTTIADVSAGNSSSVTFQSRGNDGQLHWHTLEWTGAGAPLTLDGATLMDGVQAMSLTYIHVDRNGNEVRSSAWSSNSRGIEVSITPADAGGRAYKVRAFCRNIAA